MESWPVAIIAVLLAGPPVVITRQSLPALAEATDACLEELPGAVVLDLDRESAARIGGRIRELSPPVIVAIGLNALRAALDAPPAIPVAYTMVSSPRDSLGTKLPGRVAGTRLNPEPAVVLRALRALAPRTHRILVLYDPERSRHLFQETQAAASALGMELVAVPTPDRSAVARVLTAAPPGCDAILFLLDVTVLYQEAVERLLRIGAERGIPVVGLSPEHCVSGALLSVTSDPTDLGRTAGELAAAIVAGERPPQKTRWPRRVRVFVNPAVARRLGVEVPARAAGTRVEACRPGGG